MNTRPKKKLKDFNLRRSLFLSLTLEDTQVFDVDKLCRGELKIFSGESSWVAFSAVSGERVDIDPVDLRAIRNTPNAEWIGFTSLCERIQEKPERLAESVEKLVGAGVLLSDAGSEQASAAFDRHEAAVALGWPRAALTFHQKNMAKELETPGEKGHGGHRAKVSRMAQDADAFIGKKGEPPSLFFEVNSEKSVQLETPRLKSEFFRVLESRRSTRFFDAEVATEKSVAEALLFYTFGTLEIYRISPRYAIQHKASASGGGLHPVEAFPLISSVQGIDPGIYHYNSGTHRLDMLQRLEQSQVREMARHFGFGQSYLEDAGMVVALVARVRRNFWKYHGRENTFNVIMQDCGHLSQTFYLTASALGVGALYTAALRHRDILRELNLDGLEFAPIGLCACGPTADGPPEFKPESWLLS